ncbi:hypothetical protein [Marivita sp.]|uniref:hypothetical protein n=1 Tax=Marivita sp. TaxID=2003365 RepID=UPI003F71033F
MIRLLLLSLATLLIFAEPASADPLSGLLAAGKAFLATKIGAIVAQVALSSGLSLIAQRLRKKPKQPGLQNQFKGRGGSEPGSFVLGRAAVKGHQTYHNSRGDNSKFYHEVIELCDLPGATLERLIIDGEYSEIGDDYLDDNFDSEDPRAQLGNIVVSKNKDSDSHRAWIKYYDGTHTTADAMLVSFFASDDRRWTTDHKLLGICHTVESYYFDRKRFPRGQPEKSYEMLGPPCYDPRKDTSVGGSGSHRYDDPDTWEQTENLIVLVYNILRGIDAPGGGVWGGDCEHEDLPMANWVAAMNACDIDVDGRAKYTGGIEARWTDEPRDIIDQLLAGCNGQITELGGVYRVQVDAPETAIVSLTDDDFSVSDPSELDPFPGLDGTFNGGSVTHPDPAQLWNASAAHTITNPTWETQDGTRRLFDLQLPVVHNTAQAKQVLNAAINDGRRFRRHKGTLPPDLFFMDTLNTFAWTSVAEGYSNKLFEISETAYDLLTFNTVRSIRERDPSDFPIVPGLELPGLPTATGTIARPDAGVPGFDIVPVTVDDGNGNRRITFKLIWTAAAIEDTVDGISYELRLNSSEELVLTGDIADVSAGQAFLPGSYIPGSSYDARGKAISRVRETGWTSWITEIAPAVSDGVRIVQLTTGVQVFTYNAAGASPAPTSTVFTATPRGAGGTPYYEFFVDDVSQGAPSTTATFTYTPKASAANMPDVVRVEMRDGGATEPVVASDRVTVIGLVPGEKGVAMILTNEAHTVPAAPDGSGEDLAGAFTDVQVYVGAQLDTSNWTISRVNGTGVSSSLSGNRITVTDLNVDAGHVDITASRSGFSSITKRFTLTKARKGVTGDEGPPGAPGSPGPRGPGEYFIPVSSILQADTAGEVNTRFISAVGTPVEMDTATFYTGTLANPSDQITWRRSGGAWTQIVKRFKGSVIIDETVFANALVLDGLRLQNNSGQLSITTGGVSTPYLALNATGYVGRGGRSVAVWGTGLASAKLAGLVSLDLPPGETVDILITLGLDQGYSGSGDWGIKITRSGDSSLISTTDLLNRSGMAATVDYPTLFVTDQVTTQSWMSPTANEYNVTANWYGESTVQLRKAFLGVSFKWR